MRWLRRPGDTDLTLDRTMIPLGSSTVALNAAAEIAASAGLVPCQNSQSGPRPEG
jgi:glycine dehydrogenase